MIARTVLVLGFLVATTGCAPSIKAHYDSDPQADFTGYKTWAWISNHPMVLDTSGGQTINPLWEGRIKVEIKSGLEAKGYGEVDDADQANFAVSFTLGARQGISSTSYLQFLAEDTRILRFRLRLRRSRRPTFRGKTAGITNLGPNAKSSHHSIRSTDSSQRKRNDSA